MPHRAESGGGATVFDTTHDAFSLPVPSITQEHRKVFFVGNSFFNQNWVSAPSSLDSRDGLGPLFNARSCSTCHFKDGRGRPPEAGQPLASMLVRISLPDTPGPSGAPAPDPVYGDQIQGSGLPGVLPEADVSIDVEELAGAFPDGERYVLEKPHYRLGNVGYGAPAPGLHISARVAPALIGLGLLEGVSEAALQALADPDDRNRDSISGKLNRVPDVRRHELAPGRFGWKAEQPNVLQQSAAAFLGDMGLSSSLFASDNLSEHQASALGKLPNGGTPEVTDQILGSVTLYARLLGVPARRNIQDPDVSRGEDIFAELGCAHCHVPSLPTETSAELPELEAGDIHPYTDLLLHDMGEPLSDQRPAFGAEGREWRTPPLWGLGLIAKVNNHTRLLHDGRARDTREAILWHGGEAERSRAEFMNRSLAERHMLLAFLDSL